MEWFFCITFTFFIFVYFLKRMGREEPRQTNRDTKSQYQKGNSFVSELDKEAERRRKKDINELKKQGYDDELIAVILPTINNRQ